MERQLTAAMVNEKVATAMEVIGSSSASLLVFGRYVPGLRFVVNATLGLAGHPYGEFLRWSAVGGVAWSIYICGVAYAVGTALVDNPLAAVIIAGLASSSSTQLANHFENRIVTDAGVATEELKTQPKTPPNDVRGPTGKTAQKTRLFTNLYERRPDVSARALFVNKT